MSEHEFVAKRVAKMTDNAECTPADLLKMVLHEIETGQISVESLMVITQRREAGGSLTVRRYRANLPRQTEIAMLGVAHHEAIRDWIS